MMKIEMKINFFTRFLFQRYPVMWQGSLALKNDSANVQMHFVSGGNQLVNLSMPTSPMADGALNVLRIAQRMRLENAQLDAVARRMMVRTKNDKF